MSSINPHIVKAAREFWSLSDMKYRPGCDIFEAIHLSPLPVDIVILSELSLHKVGQWLIGRRVYVNIEANDRPLHGFIITHAGSGIIFINGCDIEEDQRYTAAHEISHFILDYKLPRDRAINKLGKQITAVLDGYREPTIEERIDGFLSSVSIKPYAHLLEKNGNGSFNSIKVYDSENDADALAVELLAPYSDVIKDIKPGKDKTSFSEFRAKCKIALMEKYRLPESIAKEYAIRLSYIVVGTPSLLDKLGF